MQNARLGESQATIKIARKNINNLRYADDTILMAESVDIWQKTTKFCKAIILQLKNKLILKKCSRHLHSTCWHIDTPVLYNE